MGKRDTLKPWPGHFPKVAAVAFFLPAILELRKRDWKQAIGTQGNEGDLASPATQPETGEQAPKGEGKVHAVSKGTLRTKTLPIRGGN